MYCTVLYCTVLYCHTKQDRPDTAVTFWNTKTGDKYQKHVKSLLGVASEGEHCVLATKNDDNINPYGLIICNNLGRFREIFFQCSKYFFATNC